MFYMLCVPTWGMCDYQLDGVRCSPTYNFVERKFVMQISNLPNVVCEISNNVSVIQDPTIMGVEYDFYCFESGFPITFICDNSGVLWVVRHETLTKYDQENSP